MPVAVTAQDAVHDEAHDAFMMLPDYSSIREGETAQLGSSPLPAQLLSEEMSSNRHLTAHHVHDEAHGVSLTHPAHTERRADKEQPVQEGAMRLPRYEKDRVEGSGWAERHENEWTNMELSCSAKTRTDTTAEAEKGRKKNAQE